MTKHSSEPVRDLRTEIAAAILSGLPSAAPDRQATAERCAEAILRSGYFSEIEAALAEALGHAQMTNFVRERLEQHLGLIRRARAGPAP